MLGQHHAQERTCGLVPMARFAIRESVQRTRQCGRVHPVICVASGGSTMDRVKRRSTYQYGTLTRESRQRGPDIWAYRYFETVDGKRFRRKRIVGTVQEYPTRGAAERACEHVRLAINTETLNRDSPSIGGLIDRYIERVLAPCLDVPLGEKQDDSSQMSYHCAKSYKSASVPRTPRAWLRRQCAPSTT